MRRAIEFLKDEVRSGFYIPTVIKQAWAEELNVLDVIDRICKKHEIQYFADWGTFLGAVRHGGFIPWDDDLDIAMLRPDYEIFRKVVDAELPEGFVIHDYERKADHWLYITRVVNNEKMCFTEEYLNDHNNFPWLAGVDIFIKDYLFSDESKEKARDKNIMNILAIADAIIDGTMSPQAISSHLNEIKKRYRIKIPGKYRKRDLAVTLYKLAEELMTKTRYEESEQIGQIFPWILKNGMNAAEYKGKYEKMIRLPFEDTTIPVPAAYIDTLSSRYKKYFEIKKVWKGHDYPFFEGQKEEMEQLLGEPMPSFKFKQEMINRPKVNHSYSLKATALDCIKELRNLLNDAESSLCDGDVDEFAQYISDSQQLAADFGTLMEETKGERRQSTINLIEALQGFCDALWEEYQKVINGHEFKSMTLSRKALDEVEKSVITNVNNRKEVLFLTVGPKEWKSLEFYYREELKNPDTDVFVLPLPLMKKNYYGKIMMTDEEIELSTEKLLDIEGVPCDVWANYNIDIHCPDRVYYQNPYDGENPCLTIPSTFYSEILQQYAEQLIYIPISKTLEFSKEDVNDCYNMKHYVLSPGVIYADKVMVQSSNIKERYVEALTNFAGEETKIIWENKISLINNADDNRNLDTHGKSILFCIGANELVESNDTFGKGIKLRLDSLYKENENLKVALIMYPGDKRQWQEVDKDLADAVYESVYSAVENEKYDMISVDPLDADGLVESYDAYYGSPSPYMTPFLIQEKPVMIANYKV